MTIASGVMISCVVDVPFSRRRVEVSRNAIETLVALTRYARPVQNEIVLDVSAWLGRHP